MASSPSIPGMATSIRIMSGAPAGPRAMSTASCPSEAVSTLWPAFSSTRRHSRCATSLSSATSTVSDRPTDPDSGMPELGGRCHRFGRERDREVECGSVAERAFDPDLATVHLHDLLNDREAEASPSDRLGGSAADAAEALENMADLVRRDS